MKFGLPPTAEGWEKMLLWSNVWGVCAMIFMALARPAGLPNWIWFPTFTPWMEFCIALTLANVVCAAYFAGVLQKRKMEKELSAV